MNLHELLAVKPRYDGTRSHACDQMCKLILPFVLLFDLAGMGEGAAEHTPATAEVSTA